MKGVRIHGLAIALVLVVAGAIHGAPTTASLRVTRLVEPRVPQVGQPFDLTIVVEGTTARAVTLDETFPAEGGTTWVRVSSRQPFTVVQRGSSKSFVTRVVGIYAGLQPLPPVRLKDAGGQVFQYELEPVYIATNLHPDELTTSSLALGLALTDDSPILPRPPLTVNIIGLVLIIALAAWLVNAVRRAMQRRAVRRRALLLPADVRALRELDRLEAEGLVAKRQIKEFYSRLSDTVRSYLGTIFEFESMECTTSELMEELEDRPVTEAMKEEIRDLLEEADLVKFARYRPEPRICERALDRARNIVRTVQPPAPPAPEQQPEAAARS
jgi:hypothetical protein